MKLANAQLGDVLELTKSQGGLPPVALQQIRRRMKHASLRKEMRQLSELDNRNSQIYRKLKDIENVHQTRLRLQRELKVGRGHRAGQQKAAKVFDVVHGLSGKSFDAKAATRIHQE